MVVTVRIGPDGNADAVFRSVGQVAAAVVSSQILNWALEGWSRLRERGRFDPPECMRAALRSFKSQNNPFNDFVSLCIKENPDRMVLREDFRVCFNGWLKAEVQAKNEWSGKSIANAMKSGLPKVVGAQDSGGRGRVWIGIEFTSDALLYLNQFGEIKRTLVE